MGCVLLRALLPWGPRIRGSHMHSTHHLQPHAETGCEIRSLPSRNSQSSGEDRCRIRGKSKLLNGIREGVNSASAGPETGRQERANKGRHILDLPLPVGNAQFSNILH